MEKHIQRRLLSGEEIIKGNEAIEVRTYELMSLMKQLSSLCLLVYQKEQVGEQKGRKEGYENEIKC